MGSRNKIRQYQTIRPDTPAVFKGNLQHSSPRQKCACVPASKKLQMQRGMLIRAVLEEQLGHDLGAAFSCEITGQGSLGSSPGFARVWLCSLYPHGRRAQWCLWPCVQWSQPSAANCKCDGPCCCQETPVIAGELMFQDA